ncbi:hypothetical protein DM860_017168 [Cuscuta australis]|uniref:Uncharacterized protein n=1 Tax=Cuscuta australis TaxID=267555 RepID=A0A328DXE5_9ASTE|nr:hypothetical protein DM860_017168 [Cuscuta australis]
MAERLPLTWNTKPPSMIISITPPNSLSTDVSTNHANDSCERVEMIGLCKEVRISLVKPSGKDVIQGLLYLYFNCQRGFGHIAFNTFITDNVEGRTLPSIDDNEKKDYSYKDVEDDAKELTGLMKRVITFTFVDDATKTGDAKLAVNLPSELVHFFSFTCKFVGTVYKHVNDPEYRRSNDEECDGREFRDSLADTDIEADLHDL